MPSKSNDSFQNKEYHDILIFHPKLLQITDEKTMRVLYHHNYYPITMALRAGPMTFKELVKAYNETAEKPKSENTIYRYLKALKEEGIITNAGQRVVVGKRTNEILYSRTARIFFEADKEENQKIVQNEIKILNILLESLGKTISDKCLEIFLTELKSELRRSRNQTVSQLTKVSDNEVLKELFSHFEWDQTKSFINLVAIIMWLSTNTDTLNRIKECFKS
jgi:DNA-binding transcriptional ArsR family regulator